MFETLCRRRSSLGASFLLVFSVISACSGPQDESFDPRGAQIALYGEWDVNGMNPAVSDACNETGLATVELAFFDTETGEEFTHHDFRFPCVWGVYESGVGVLRSGAYEYVWRAYEEGAERPALSSSRYPLAMTGSGEFILRAVDFIRASNP